MRRLIQRTIRRAVTREEMWNGNREPIGGMFRRDARENIILWSWTHHAECARRYGVASRHQDNAHLSFVRLSSDAAIDDLLSTARRRVDA